MNDHNTEKPTANPVGGETSARLAGSLPNLYETKSWELSCDNCAGQEDGGHYCLVFSQQVKNMNIKRCSSWHPKN